METSKFCNSFVYGFLAYDEKCANTNIRRNIDDKGIEYAKMQIQILKEILMTMELYIPK